MEPNEVNINVTPKDGVVEIRTGVALPLKEPRQLSLSGIITTVGDFVYKRVLEFEKLQANVVANYPSRSITLCINEESAYFGIVKGQLSIHPELAKLGINEETMYDEKQLFKKLNFFQRWFKNKEQHSELMSKLQKFKVKVNQVFTNSDDYKGAAAIEKLTNIEHDISLEFALVMPLFAGGENFEFKVNINVSLKNGEVTFWLESVELHVALQTQTDTVFQKELERLKEYVIVKQY